MFNITTIDHYENFNNYFRVCCECATLKSAGLVFTLVLVQGHLTIKVLVTQLAVGYDPLKLVSQNGKPIALLKKWQLK